MAGLDVPYGPRGALLWAAYCERSDGEIGLALLAELCRTADRLDKLDALLSGEADVWCRLVDGRTDGYELQIDGALVEARQQAQALAKLWAALPLKAADEDDGDTWLEGLSSEVRNP